MELLRIRNVAVAGTAEDGRVEVVRGRWTVWAAWEYTCRLLEALDLT